MGEQNDSNQPGSNKEKTESSQGVTTNIPVIEVFRIDRAYKLGLYGICFIILLALVLALMGQFNSDKADAVSKVVSPFLTVLGTMIGVFFGVQVGSAGREEATKQAQDANDRATAFAAAASPKDLEAAIKAYQGLKGKG